MNWLDIELYINVFVKKKITMYLKCFQLNWKLTGIIVFSCINNVLLKGSYKYIFSHRFALTLCA